MKWIPLVLAVFLIFAGSASGATLSLKATWTPNTESDMAGYNLYRTDGTRTKINATLIPFLTGTTSTAQYSFTVTVSSGAAGTMTFVMTAVDTSNNESLDSNTASYSYDLAAPAAPGTVSIIKQ
jgi:hypothetical protein